MYSDHIISEGEHSAWLDRALSSVEAEYWIIVCDERDVGLVNLYRKSAIHQTAYWAFYIADDSTRGKGVGSFVEFFVLDYVFVTLGLERLSCEVLETNPVVVSMHESFGFVREGVFRKDKVKEGRRVDVISLGILRAEWEEFRPRHEIKLREKRLI